MSWRREIGAFGVGIETGLNRNTQCVGTEEQEREGVVGTAGHRPQDPTRADPRHCWPAVLALVMVTLDTSARCTTTITSSRCIARLRVAQVCCNSGH